MATNAYQKLVSKKSDFCKGKVLKSDVKRAATNYVLNAVEKAKKSAGSKDIFKVQKKARTHAEKVANRVLRGGCKLSSAITGRKKKSAKRKTTKRKR